MDNHLHQLQLGNSIHMRTSQDIVLWSIFGTFAAANAILLVALFPRGDIPENPVVGITVAAVGSFLTIIWGLIQLRTLTYIERGEALIRRIECQLGIPSCYQMSEIFMRPGVRSRHLILFLIVAAACGWDFGLYYFVSRL